MDTYYQLLDKDTSTVTPMWKAIHLVSFVIVVVSGFISAYAFGKAIEAFGGNCVLFPKIIFIEKNDTSSPRWMEVRELPGDLKPLHTSATEWGSESLCHFCHYTPLVSMLFGIIWGAFFIMCAKGGAGYITDTIYRPWRIVYPALVFTAISTFLMLLSTWELNAGVDNFCAQFKSVFNSTRCINEIDDYTLTFHDIRKRCIIILKVAVAFSYVCFLGWVLQLVTLMLRIICIADFQMIKITVNPKDEEVVMVVSPDDATADGLLPISEKESIDSSSDDLPNDRKRKISFLSRLRERKSSVPTSIDVAPKLLESPPTNDRTSRQSHHRVSFADETPTAQEDKRISLPHSVDQNSDIENMSLAELKSYIAGENNTETTSFSPTEEHYKTPASSPPLGQTKVAMNGGPPTQSPLSGSSYMSAVSDESKSQNGTSEGNRDQHDVSVQTSYSRLIDRLSNLNSKN